MTAGTYAFGECELDDVRWELRRRGERVDLQPKTLELLFFLVQNRERVVPKRELLRAVWPGVVIGESSLTRSMSLARRAIGDTSARDGMIRTYARKGYRFCAPTREGDSAPARLVPARLASLEPSAAAREEEGIVRLPVELPFVGRERLLLRLADAEREAGRGRGQVSLLIGCAGIGKTRLLDEAARQAKARGARTVRACCREDDGAPPYWPWIQILRALATDPDAQAAQGALAVLEAAIDGTPSAGASERSRFRTFDAIARALEDSARRAAPGPLVILLDDAHRADPASWLLVRHLLDELSASRCSLVLALRDGPDVSGPLAERVLADMRRSEGCRVHALEGFGVGEIEGLLGAALERSAPAALIDALARETEGNPFYVREVLRWLEECGDLDDDWEHRERWNVRIPGSARESVHARIRGASTECREVLECAAVLGREFSLELVSALAELPRASVLDALDEAVRRQLVAAREPLVAYAFTHALVRDVLYEGIASAQCAELHRRAGECLEKRHSRDRERVLPELAHHFFRASAAGECDRGITYALGAARQADSLCAHEEAALHYGRARTMLEAQAPVDAERRLSVLLDLGRAQGAAGNTEARREAYREAAASARALGRAEALAEAALGHCGSGEWRTLDPASRALLDEALGSARDPGLQARILSRLAHAPLESGAARERSLEALRKAERSGDPEALCEAYHARHYVLEGPDSLAERARVVEEIVRHGTRAGRSDLVFEIHLEHLADALVAGERDAAEQELARAAELSARAGQPWFRWLESLARVGFSLMDGALASTEPALERAAAQGRRLENPWAIPFSVAQRVALERARGTPQALEPLLAAVTPSLAGGTALLRAVMAGVQCEIGRTEIARELCEAVAARGFAALPKRGEWLATATELAHVSASLEQRAHCAELYELLLPYASLHAALPVIVCYGGPVSAALARTAAVCGERERATAHFETARAASQRVSARVWQLRVEIDFGRFLLGSPSTRDHGRELLRDAAARAQVLELRALADAATRALDAASDARKAPRPR